MLGEGQTLERKSCFLESEAKHTLEEMVAVVQRKGEKLLPGQDSGAEEHSEYKRARGKVSETKAFRGSEGLGVRQSPW